VGRRAAACTRDGVVSAWRGRLPEHDLAWLLPTGRRRARRPEGEAGELWIGGVGRRSRLPEPAELTAERFVPDRFGTRGPGRL